MPDLPVVDEHSTPVDAPPAVVWTALVEQLRHTLGRPATAYLRVVRGEPARAEGDFPAQGSALPGFRVEVSEPGRRIRLTGRHHFSAYALDLRIESRPGGSTLRAETDATFPGLGAAYRLLVVGSGGHGVLMRRLLRGVRRRAEALDERWVASAERVIAAPASALFELVADPSRHASYDGNDNLEAAAIGQRVRQVGDVFSTLLTLGSVRENHVVELEEGRRIAWRPAEVGSTPPGHLWRWELEPLDDERTLVRHTYDWSELADPDRLPRARRTTTERLRASLDRLATVAEGTK